MRCIQKLWKNSLKTSFWGDQGRSRSSMLINPKSLSPVLVIINRMYVPICNRFHIIWANIGKMTSFFRGVPFFDALVRREPLHPVTRNFVTINQTPWGSHNKDFVTLACTVLIQLTSVTDGRTNGWTDGRTDRRTDAQTMAKTREAFCFRA